MILYTAPGYKTYVQMMDSGQWNTTIKTVTEITRRYSDNTVYYNWLNDPDFVAGDYYDADHVNEIGAKKLSKKMDSVLNTFDVVPVAINSPLTNQPNRKFIQ